MSLGLRLSLLTLLIAGCASQLLVVPDSDWQTVPPAQRTTLDRQYEADVVAARAELTAASISLAEAQHAPATPAVAPRPAAASGEAVPDPDDAEWLAAVRRYEQETKAALGRIEAANAAQHRADLAWRQLRLETAQARLDMLASGRELARAKAIDRNLLGTDTYDSAPLRGQFSRAQRHWYAAETRSRQARATLDQATARLNAAKETYAQLMRGGPLQAFATPTADQPGAEPAPVLPRLQLTGWMIKRSDIRLRRGLGRYRQEADNAPSRLRTATASPRVRPPAPKASTAKPARDVTATSTTAAATPSATTSTATPTPAAATAAARPAASTRPAAAAGRPAAATPATVTARPIEASATVSASNKPSAPPRTAPPPPAAKPIEPAVRP